MCFLFVEWNQFMVLKIFRSRGFRYGTVRKQKKRVILKNGECNIVQSKMSQKRLRFIQDIFTTFVDVQWRYTVFFWLLFSFDSRKFYLLFLISVTSVRPKFHPFLAVFCNNLVAHIVHSRRLRGVSFTICSR